MDGLLRLVAGVWDKGTGPANRICDSLTAMPSAAERREIGEAECHLRLESAALHWDEIGGSQARGR